MTGNQAVCLVGCARMRLIASKESPAVINRRWSGSAVAEKSDGLSSTSNGILLASNGHCSASNVFPLARCASYCEGCLSGLVLFTSCISDS